MLRCPGSSEQACALPIRSRCYDGEVIHPANQAIPSRLRTVFLDRDGILNEKMPEGQYVTRWEDFHVLPGAPEALLRLNEAGMRVVVVSNQRGIARGFYTTADVDAIHEALQRHLNATAASRFRDSSSKLSRSSPRSPPPPA
jgi:D-glycero-D-manno-heptose 1,7-bisphosphate phosphatase